MQVIVFDNGVASAGAMGEHGVVDGTHGFHVFNEVLGFLAKTSNYRLHPFVVPPEPLDFDRTPIPGIHDAMYKFQEFVHDVASSKAPSSLKTYCGNAAVKGFGVGPDGWVQMVIQIAYASLTERFGGDNGPVRP